MPQGSRGVPQGSQEVSEGVSEGLRGEGCPQGPDEGVPQGVSEGDGGGTPTPYPHAFRGTRTRKEVQLSGTTVCVWGGTR